MKRSWRPIKGRFPWSLFACGAPMTGIATMCWYRQGEFLKLAPAATIGSLMILFAIIMFWTGNEDL